MHGYSLYIVMKFTQPTMPTREREREREREMCDLIETKVGSI
jgi:hypothetical protein